MDRLTTNEPHDNQSALLNFAYAKDRRVILSFAAGEDSTDLAEYISLQALRNGCDVSSENVLEGSCMECDCPVAILNTVAIQAAELRARLMMIEDILGDTYDLDYLRKLVEADREGRRWPFPCKIGDQVFVVVKYHGSYDVVPSIVAALTVDEDGEFIVFDKGRVRPVGEWGNRVFPSREAAEAALAKMKEGEQNE